MENTISVAIPPMCRRWGEVWSRLTQQKNLTVTCRLIFLGFVLMIFWKSSIHTHHYADVQSDGGKNWWEKE